MSQSTKKDTLNSRTTDEFNKEEEISENNVQIMTFNFLLNVVGLLPPDNATPFIKFVYKLFIAGLLVIDTITLSWQLIAVVVHWGNIPLIATTMSVMNGLIVSMITCIYFLHSKTKFLGLVDLLRTEFVAKVKSKYIKFIQNAERQIKYDVLLSSPKLVNCGFMWTVAPLLNNNAVSNFEDKNATTGDRNLEKIIFVMWAPFETEGSPQFEIIFLLQFIIISLAIIQLYAVDIMFLSLMSHAAAQLKVLQAMLSDIHQNISENYFHTTKDVTSLHITTDGNEAHSSEDGSISLQSWIRINDHSENPSTQMVCPKDDQLCKDQFREYLVECIKYHQAIIE
jgi:hypothetical protein